MSIYKNNNKITDYDDSIDLTQLFKYGYTGSPNTTNTTNTPSTTTIGATHSHTTSNIGNHSHSLNTVYSPNSHPFYKQHFSKSSFVNDVILGDQSVFDYISDYTDDGVLEFMECCEKFSLLTDEVFWLCVKYNLAAYPLYTEFHQIDKCLEVIENTKNKKLIKYTADAVRNDIEFKRGVNKLKLKGVL